MTLEENATTINDGKILINHKYKCPKCNYEFMFNNWTGDLCQKCYRKWIDDNVPKGELIK